ncbi:MAG: hypothetical protein KBG48_29695 [Kofleriaceae bacterium]|jgi:hypothetical protein|nr:hypothetical protein [Kofleriaceae bacterium]MBP9171601.1 hypothetical protein [Kofleriaceae bacterium]MBP9858940.1 hypothetical protein [Kofleriaceae bacterium]
MSETKENGYKRINFFKGFLTTEKDWNEAEKYHIDKRMLHNRLFHSPGVALGYGGDLRVAARARGDLSVEIQPGYAIDGVGHDLMLFDAAIKNINPEEFRLPQTIYIVLRFYEELSDFIAYKENLEYKGHRRVLESCKIEVSQTEPDIGREVELARIYLEKGANRVRDARDPADPRANEIDMRFVPKAGRVGSFMPPAQRLRLQNLLWQIRRAGLEYARRGIHSANNVVQCCNTALMLDASNTVDLRNIFDIFYLLIESQGEMALDIDAHHPAIAQKKEFSEFRRHVEILRGLISEGKFNMESFQNMLAYQGKLNEIAQAAISGEKLLVQVKEEPKEDKPKVADIKDWEGVKVMPYPKESMDLEGLTWVLVDEIKILDNDSEAKHAFNIKEAKDSYRSRQKLKYPDGTVIEGVGRAHVGGFAEFKINVTPGRPVVILRRMDYVYGDYELEMQVNNKAIGVVNCTGTDRVHRWRNWPAMIPGEQVTESTLTIKQIALTAGRDVNMFHIWVYQPK